MECGGRRVEMQFLPVPPPPTNLCSSKSAPEYLGDIPEPCWKCCMLLLEEGGISKG